jgi:probable phosphoglycerate mutase
MTQQSRAGAPQPESADSTADDRPDLLTPVLVAMEHGLLAVGKRTEVILIRHAQQRRSLDELYRPGGPYLSDLGLEQARLTGEYLAAEQPPVDAVYCSDLNRARQTAEIIAAAVADGQPPKLDNDLREVDVHRRDRAGAELSTAGQAAAGQEFARTLRWDAFPNVEVGRDVRRRMYTSVQGIAADHPNGRVVIVSHAGAISAVVAELLGAQPDMFYLAGHASVNRILHGNNRFVVDSLNEVGHLRARGVFSL